MKLYKKNLRNIKELREEKAALKRDADASLENLFTFKSMFTSPDDTEEEKSPGGTAKEGSDNTPLEDILNVLLSRDVVETAFELLKPFIITTGTKKILKPIAKELVSGYLKWKAAELGFKSAFQLMRHYKKKHRAENAD